MTTTLVSTDRTSWNRYVAASPQGSVFCRAELLDALDLTWEVRSSGGGDAPEAAALVLRDAGVVVRAPVPFCLYQGILLPSRPDEASHRRVRRELEAVSALLDGLSGEARLSWCLHPSLTDIRALSWFHYHEPELGQFRVEVRYTGIIALDPVAGLDGVLAGSRTVRRQEYRKASARFRVEVSNDLDLLDGLHRRTFDRQGIVRSDREGRLLRSIAAAALEHGFGELLVAYDHDSTAAGAVLYLFDETSAYYLVAANHPDFRSTGVSTLLFLSGAERAMARGLTSLDAVGLNSPSRGDFKTSFGAVPTPYYVATWERP